MLKLPTALIKRPNCSTDELGKYIYWQFGKARNIRLPVEADWDAIYRLYRASKTDMQKTYADSFQHGNKRNSHHRINTGKTFSVVETLIAYFKGATFPSDDWFDATAMAPDLGEVAAVIKAFAKAKMNEGRIVDIYEEWLRWYIIYGIATFKVCWTTTTELVYKRTFDELGLPSDVARTEDVSKLEFEAVSPIDVWVDSGSPLNEGGIWRRLRPSKQDLYYWESIGYITVDIKLLEGYDDSHHGDPTEVKDASTTQNDQNRDVIEYYGKVLYKGVQYAWTHAIFLGSTLIRLADSEYWCGSPYVTSAMYKNRDSVYGMSILDPAHGSLHILNVLANSRLDNLAVFIDRMWTMIPDGILNEDDVYTEPGKVFKVASHDTLKPLDMGSNNAVVTYQEGQYQELAINEVTSTGPLIGGGQPRSGERVTAEEIISVKESGGNRLFSAHTHIEESATKPLLSKVFLTLQQYVINPEIVKVFMPEIDMNAYFNLDPVYLSYPFQLVPNGANYVIEKQRQLADLMQLLDISGRVPPMAEMINYKKILAELLKQMRFRNPQSYLMPEAATPGIPEEEAVDLEESLGGEQMQLGIEQQIQEDGGAGLLGGVGIDASAVPTDVLQTLTQPLLE